MALSPRLIAITKQIDRFTDLVGLGGGVAERAAGAGGQL